MAEALYLLPGWGLSVQLLAPLAAALKPAFAVHLLEQPASLEQLDAQVPAGAWLGGWSLGGMLAVALAARRGAACPGVISLASNACFSAREGWPWAMAEGTFGAFLAGCEQAPAATLKRFTLLCAQGAEQPRELARQLAAQPGAASVAGLQWLAALDNRAALGAFSGAQCHLLAELDGLVPASALPALRALAPQAHWALLANASHAFPVQATQQVARMVIDWRLAHG
ncbi:transporter [Pseudomonas sp. NPDC007930]|uniref:transporter n=1 Tax=Pseudomonas sp. NPDC007930 TaxID=3364417 RepID=UPI0036E5C66B